MIGKQHIYNWITVAIFFIATGTIQAQNYTVNSLADTNTGAGTAGTLRWCINQANGAAGPHTITFVAGGIGTILLTSDLPVVSVADVTIDGTSAGGATSVIIDGGVGDITRYMFRANAGGTNATFRGMTTQDTGYEPFNISGSPTGVTIEDIVIRNTVATSRFFNYGIYMANNATDLTVTNVTMTHGQAGWYGIYVGGTSTNVLIDNFDYSDGGWDTFGMRFAGVVNGLTIQNCDIDLDYLNGTNDGNYGIYFNSTATNVTIDNLTMHDAEVYGIYVGGQVTDFTLTNSTMDNLDGWVAAYLVFFDSAAAMTGLTVTNVTLDGDYTGSNDSADYGIRLDADSLTNATFTDLTINNISAYGIWFDDTTNNVTFNNFVMNNPQGWTNSRALQFDLGATDVTINGATIDMDVDWSTDDGDYGIAFDGTTNNVSLDNITIHDAEVYGLYFGNVATDITLTNSTFDNLDGWENNQMIRFNSTVNNLTMTDVTIDGDKNATTDSGDYGVYLASTVTTANFTNLTINNQQYYGMRFLNGGSNISFTNFDMTNLQGGTTAIGLDFIGTYTNLTIDDAVIDLRVTATNNSGDYGIAIDTNTNTNFNNLTVHDAGVNGIHLGGVTTDFTLTNSVFDVFNTNNNNINIRFQNVVNGITMTDVTIDEDVTGTTNDGEYGIYFDSHINQDVSKNAVFTRLSIHQADQMAFNTRAIVNNLTIEGSSFTRTNIEADPLGSGVEFWNNGAKTNITINNSTFTDLSRGGIVMDMDGTNATANNKFTNNTISGTRTTGGDSTGIWVVDFAAVTDLEISGNTIFDSELNGITIQYADGVNITQNNIYNNGLLGIDNQNNNGNNDLELADGDVPYITNSINTGVDTYDVTFTLPVECTSCDVEFFTNQVGDRFYNGRTYVQTATGLAGVGPHTVSVNSGGNNTGFWTATLKAVTGTGSFASNSSVSEFSFPFKINQTVAPGCVADGLTLWLKPSNGVTLNGSDVSDWQDQVLGVPFSQAIASQQPAFIAGDATTNFNPTLVYNRGTGDDLVTPDNVVLTTANASIFSAVKNTGFTGYQSILNIDDDEYGYGAQTANMYLWDNGSVIDVTTTLQIPPSLNTSIGLTHTAGGTSVFYFDNEAENTSATANATPDIGIGADITIGGQLVANQSWNGNVYEVATWNRPLTTAEQQKVNTYYAIKYGFMMNLNTTTNLLAGDDTVIWDVTTNATYNNNIAGIGREDCQELNQKQSKSADATAITPDLTIGLASIEATNAANTATFTNDKAYLVWGNNGDDTSTTVSTEFENTKHVARIDREWFVQNTNMDAADVVDLEITNLPALTATQFYTLVFDDDGDFSDGNSTEIRMTTNNEFGNVAFPAGNTYFTIMITVVNAVLTLQQDGDEEGPVDLIFRISLETPSNVPVVNNLIGDITFDIADLLTGTATTVADYAAIPAQVTLLSGNAFVDLNLVVVDDTVLEDTETVNAQISNPSVTQITIITADATGNILDNEPRNFMRHGKTFQNGTEQPMKF